jgi:hypothetical protein
MRPYTFSWKQWAIAICQLFVVLACSREDEVLLPDGNSAIVTFSAGSLREEWADFNPEDVRDTRISNTAWTTGDEVGIYMLPAGVTNLATNSVWKNRKHTIDASGKLNPAGAENMLYYPINGTGVRFVAYYPYASGATSANKVTINFADQSTKAKKESKDFCFHRGTTSYTKGTPALGFKHKFSKILINLSKGAGGPSCSGIKASLSGIPASATVDLAKLAADAAGENNAANLGIATAAGTISAYTHSGSKENAATVEAVVAPHSGTGNFAVRKFTFTTSDGKTKIYELPKNVTFETGKVYTFTLKLMPSTKVIDGMANCYIVTPGAELKFPVSRAYTFGNGAFTNTLRVGGTYTGAFTAAVVWDDNGVINGTPAVSGSGNKAEVTVKTTAKSGNAVVRICKNGEATPVWSYHIWVTNYDPGVNTFTNKDKDNKHTWVFMNRNLGATATGNTLAARGLLYQWGRKDPFPGAKAGTAGFSALNKFIGIPDAGSTVPVRVSGPTNAEGIVESIRKPATFLTEFFRGDWLPNTDAELWGLSGLKTVYDPCPAGWRVPVNYNGTKDTSPWYNFPGKPYAGGDGDMAAADWSVPSGANNAVYPACGYRGQSGGTIDYEGRFGYYWSAGTAFNSKLAFCLVFFNNSVSSYDNLDQANALSVRCVQE